VSRTVVHLPLDLCDIASDTLPSHRLPFSSLSLSRRSSRSTSSPLRSSRYHTVCIIQVCRITFVFFPERCNLYMAWPNLVLKPLFLALPKNSCSMVLTTRFCTICSRRMRISWWCHSVNDPYLANQLTLLPFHRRINQHSNPHILSQARSTRSSQ
jgi:hypothetical protein